jgi:hypothetical protein
MPDYDGLRPPETVHDRCDIGCACPHREIRRHISITVTIITIAIINKY